MIVSSHRFDRAEALAAELGGKAVHYDTYEDLMDRTDILIASTLAPITLVREEQVRAWMRRRQGRPLFLIDIAVPRNIDPAAEKLDNVYLYNVDDLQGIANQNKNLREGQLAECLELIKGQSDHFMGWLSKEFRSTGA